MNTRALWLALASVLVGSAFMFASRADSIVAGLPTDFWAGFLLVIAAALATLAAIALFHRPSVSRTP